MDHSKWGFDLVMDERKAELIFGLSRSSTFFPGTRMLAELKLSSPFPFSLGLRAFAIFQRRLRALLKTFAL